VDSESSQSPSRKRRKRSPSFAALLEPLCLGRDVALIQATKQAAHQRPERSRDLERQRDPTAAANALDTMIARYPYTRAARTSCKHAILIELGDEPDRREQLRLPHTHFASDNEGPIVHLLDGGHGGGPFRPALHILQHREHSIGRDPMLSASTPPTMTCFPSAWARVMSSRSSSCGSFHMDGVLNRVEVAG